MNKNAVYEELKKNPKNIHFNRLCSAAELFGFRFRGGKGSHRIYAREGIREALNFQNVGGWAKPYQVRQLLKIIDKYNLLKEEDDA
ncbi:type II toxin-antitoxin system HicA family toxin [Candidatus Methanoperedens nitratireducens]|uniref:YcfA family protein n=1 Tax=Candidatus Methanoperedens nitratireducens TaxID=1392998 RepID=A0A284VIX8_9EURY